MDDRPTGSGGDPLDAERIYRVLRDGSAEERQRLVTWLPPHPVKAHALRWAADPDPAPFLAALTPCIVDYCEGAALRIGMELAGAAHRLALELFEDGPHDDLDERVLSRLAIAYLTAALALDERDRVVEFAERHLPFWEGRPDASTARRLAVARADAAGDALAGGGGLPPLPDLDLSKLDEGEATLVLMEGVEPPSPEEAAGDATPSPPVQAPSEPAAPAAEPDPSPPPRAAPAPAPPPSTESAPARSGGGPLGRLVGAVGSIIGGLAGGRREEASRSAPDETGADPPRSAYGLLRCPDTVPVGEEFELVVGLAPEQQPGVAGAALRRPPSSVGPYELTVEVDADGLSLRPDESWRHELPVTRDAPYPTVTLHLTPDPQGLEPRQTRIEATFGVDGQTIGLAVRYLTVRAAGPATVGAAAAPVAPATGVTMAVPSAGTAPDLTIRIRRWDSQSGGRLRWSVESPHDVPLPGPCEGDIGAEPERFAEDLVRQMTLREGKPGLYAYLLGTGRRIMREIPRPVRQAIHDVAAQVAPVPPTCLLLSQEPCIPWELALLEPPLDSDAPPFLGTQTVLGRWTLEDEPPPQPSPPTALEVRDMAVVSGVYERVPGWRRLKEAEAEAEELRGAWRAVPVDATMPAVLGCLQGRPEADVLHFAVHGKYDPDGVQRGLALVDGQMLDPVQVEADLLRRASLVFLNACQVGSGEQVLGDYAGMAAAFLRVGAAAVIAPLWSIDDELARSVALSFYESTLGGGERPAEVLMRARRAVAGPDTTSATQLAYQFFGHPLMRVAHTPTMPPSAAGGDRG